MPTSAVFSSENPLQLIEQKLYLKTPFSEVSMQIVVRENGTLINRIYLFRNKCFIITDNYLFIYLLQSVIKYYFSSQVKILIKRQLYAFESVTFLKICTVIHRNDLQISIYDKNRIYFIKHRISTITLMKFIFQDVS